MREWHSLRAAGHTDDQLEADLLDTLDGCLGCFELAATSVHTCGDHDVALCRMLWYEDVERDAPPLRTAKLREIGILPPAPT